MMPQSVARSIREKEEHSSELISEILELLRDPEGMLSDTACGILDRGIAETKKCVSDKRTQGEDETSQDQKTP